MSDRNLLNQPKSQKIAVFMALLGAVTPLAGLHKFYLGQPLWGIIYCLLWTTPMPRIACAIEAVWYLLQDDKQFNHRFNSHQLQASSTNEAKHPAQVGAIAEALRQLDQLRADGLMSEYEFEQKRRQLLDRIA